MNLDGRRILDTNLHYVDYEANAGRDEHDGGINFEFLLDYTLNC